MNNLQDVYQFKPNYIDWQINAQVEKCLIQMKCYDKFKSTYLPFMKQKANKILQEKPIIHLLNGQSINIITREQCYSLLCLMFFELCIPQLQCPPYYNLSTYYINGSQLEKLKCFINYFLQCDESYFQLPNLQFIKQNTALNDWQIQQKLSDFEFYKKRNEDHSNCGIVDFSDQYFGGKVAAGRGCAQEEVLLLMNVEAIVGTLFITKLQDNEAIIIKGILQFNEYQGYEDSFKCIPIKYRDNQQILIAIDALYLIKYQNGFQYSKEAILRELNKCFAGFQDQKIISTGKWGCGIYGGDKQLKTLIQWIAFSAIHPDGKIIFNGLDDMAYNQLGQKLQIIKNKFNTVENLYKALINLGKKDPINYLSSNMNVQCQVNKK